jgi:choline monooxygenase
MSATLHAKLNRFDSSLPLAQARTIPNFWYFDHEIYEAERRAVFGGTWQLVGRLDQLQEPGAYFTANIAGEPILVVRDSEGKLRAFFNVCRHRAAQVMNEPQGRATRLRCRYHGWTYDLAGRLRGTPEFEGVADFCKEEQGLVEMAIDTCGSLVWVHQRQGGPNVPIRQSLADFLKPFPEKTAALNLEKLRFVKRQEYEIACNWKVFVDNYLDGGYHVNTVHPGLAGVLDYARYRTEIAGNTSVQSSPLRAPDPHLEDATAGRYRIGDSAYYWWVFPNFMINIYEGVMDTNLVLPLGPDRCKVLFDFYFADGEGSQNEQFMTDSIAVSHQIQLEDLGICEEVQHGLRSGSYSTGRFSVRREGAGYHFHRLLAEALKTGVEEGG